MADITKCEGTGCIIKNDCYRFTAPDSLRQAYFAKVPLETSRQHDGITCQYYWQKT